jgi:hypothetical protein
MRTENEQTLVVPQELLVQVLQMPVDLLVFGLGTVGVLEEFASVVVSAVVSGSSQHVVQLVVYTDRAGGGLAVIPPVPLS